jgi:anti-anti-sigma regulatory factor
MKIRNALSVIALRWKHRSHKGIAMAIFNFDKVKSGPRTLQVKGTLTLEDAASLREYLIEALNEVAPPVIDLRELEDCHPLCLGVLVSFANTLAHESSAKAILQVGRSVSGKLLMGLRHAAIELQEVFDEG